jgi:16S rRNA (guanine527-N7)-methyltransferase
VADRNSERVRLDQGLAELGLSPDAQTREKLLDYLELLRRWGKTYNLVAPGEMPVLLERHLLDSLSIAPWCGPGPLLDVGTGAGFPGLPLAALEPERTTVLLDSAGKKVRFLRHVVRELSLDRVEAVHDRVEHFSAAGGFSTITSRAFSSLADFVQGVRHLAGPQTRLLAMKGQAPVEELEALPGGVSLEALETIRVPGLDAQRHLVILSIAANQ